MAEMTLDDKLDSVMFALSPCKGYAQWDGRWFVSTTHVIVEVGQQRGEHFEKLADMLSKVEIKQPADKGPVREGRDSALVQIGSWWVDERFVRLFPENTAFHETNTPGMFAVVKTGALIGVVMAVVGDFSSHQILYGPTPEHELYPSVKTQIRLQLRELRNDLRYQKDQLREAKDAIKEIKREIAELEARDA